VLHSFIFKKNFIRAVKCGFYMDFFYKKCCEVFIRNGLIYSSYIFGEKYMIEFLTKLSVDKVIAAFNSFQDYTQADRIKLFFQVLSTILYGVSLLLAFYVLYL
jgi:hypothetical protein